MPESEFWKLSAWFDEAKASAWDKKMEADSQSGKLDFLFEEAEAQRAENALQPWPAKA